MLSGVRRFHTQARMRLDPLSSGFAGAAGRAAFEALYKAAREKIGTDKTANKLLNPVLAGTDTKARKSVFIQRPKVNAELAALLSRKGVMMLSAGSSTGKTTSMARFLSQPFRSTETNEVLVPAVCHLELREVTTPDKAKAAFRTALAVDDENLSLDKLMDIMKTSLYSIPSKPFADNTVFHPIVWVEDIHSCRADLAAEISAALLTDFPVVVHTVSENSGYRMLMDLSGHAGRLEHIPFPSITEQEILTAITTPTVQETREITLSDGTVEDKLISVNQDPVCEPEVAEYIVRKLGNNLAQIDKCLGTVRQEGDGIVKVFNRMGMVDVKKNIALITAGEATKIAGVATPNASKKHGKELASEKRGKELVLAARILFEALAQADGKAVDYTTLLEEPLGDYVELLVDLNFISYTDPIKAGNFVLFKRKSLIDGWKEAKATNSRVVAPL